MKNLRILSEKDKYGKMKDNLRSENKEYASVYTSSKATFKIKDLKQINN